MADKKPLPIDPLVLQMAMVHSLQNKVWLEFIRLYGPKGSLKIRINEAIGSLTRLNNEFKQSDRLFDISIKISDSLYEMMKLTDEEKSELTELIDERIQFYASRKKVG